MIHPRRLLLLLVIGILAGYAWWRYEHRDVRRVAEKFTPLASPKLSLDDVKVLAAIDRWAAFTANWYLRYKAVIDKYTGADGTVNYDKVVANKDYRAFLAAYLPVAADQTAAHDYATKLCADLLSSKGRTP